MHVTESLILHRVCVYSGKKESQLLSGVDPRPIVTSKPASWVVNVLDGRQKKWIYIRTIHSMYKCAFEVYACVVGNQHVKLYRMRKCSLQAHTYIYYYKSVVPF